MADTLNFFRSQDEARGRTTLLVALLSVAIAVLVLSPFVAFMTVYVSNVPQVSWYQPQIFAYTTISMLVIILIGSSIRISELAKGGGAIASQMGASLVAAHTTNSAERVLLNVVEEMALASGLPVPSCYIFAGDRTINAFAAANSSKDAAIAVTQGALANLTRDELQGVVAYVMGHVSNGDTRLSIRFIGVAGGLTAVSDVGQAVIKAGGFVGAEGLKVAVSDGLRSPEDELIGCVGMIFIIVALASLLVITGGFLAVIAAVGLASTYAIQAAVWRQRESLSDAAAVQFTRNPAGLASALKKLAVRGCTIKSASGRGTEWQNFFFAPIRGAVANSDSLRSSIADRIRFIDPTFDGVIPDLPPIDVREEPSHSTPPPLRGVPSPIASPKQLQSVFGSGGTLPLNLRIAASEPVGAMGIVLGLILRQDPALRTQQLAQAQGLAGGEVVKEALKLEVSLRALPAGHRVPLLDVAMPAIRQLSAAQVAEFGQAIDQVGCQADDGLVVLLIHASMRRYLSVAPKRMGKVGDLQASCALVLSAVVQTSGEGTDAQDAAYLKGAKVLGMRHLSLVMIPPEQVDLAEVESALGVIADKSVIDLVRRQLVNACCVAMLSDGKAEPAEIEIIRAVADTLGVSLTAA